MLTPRRLNVGVDRRMAGGFTLWIWRRDRLNQTVAMRTNWLTRPTPDQIEAQCARFIKSEQAMSGGEYRAFCALGPIREAQ